MLGLSREPISQFEAWKKSEQCYLEARHRDDSRTSAIDMTINHDKVTVATALPLFLRFIDANTVAHGS